MLPFPLFQGGAGDPKRGSIAASVTHMGPLIGNQLPAHMALSPRASVASAGSGHSGGSGGGQSSHSGDHGEKEVMSGGTCKSWCCAASFFVLPLLQSTF